jgi:putative ABC transport system substrate-binding protein
MKRREVLLASCALVLASTRARAQSGKPPRRIAILSPSTREFSRPLIEAFRAALKELGYVEGRDLVLEIRWSEGATERLPTLARELVALKPEVLVTATTAGVSAASKATSTVPVVFVVLGNPEGFVKSLSHPGGNMTGTVFRGASFVEKLAELVRESLPRAKRIALLDDGNDPSIEKTREFITRTFTALGMELTAFVPVMRAEDLAQAFAAIKKHNCEVVFAIPRGLLVSNARKLGELALQARLPLVGARRAFAEAGGLLSYDNDPREDYRRAAVFVDKILKGAKPGDLPAEQPDRFQLVVNLRTAKTLGIKIPQPVMLRATEVIE